MRRRIGVEDVDADNLVVCAGREELVVWRETDSVYRAGVVAESSQLLWLVEVCLWSVLYCFDRPESDIAI
jgi:hypothetical protein